MPLFRHQRELIVQTSTPRIRPRRPLLAAAGFRVVLPIADRVFRSKHIYRSTSKLAAEKLGHVAAQLARGKSTYLVGIGIGGFHNTGVALLEVTPQGPRIICNNEEERFSGRKHTTQYPHASLEALTEIMKGAGIGPERISAFLTTYDYPVLVAAGIRTVLEEFPASLSLLQRNQNPGFDQEQFKQGLDAPRRLAHIFGCDRPVPLIGMPHHDNHGWLSYCVSPFARDPDPVMVAVIDGSGDLGAISLYVGERGKLRALRRNASMFDSLGLFYGVISSTQGGWTFLSSEGRYMGAAAYGDLDRSTNGFYPRLRRILCLRADGQVYLNRSLADWPRHMFRRPYTAELIDILGTPIHEREMWNPDAVLRLEDIHHRPNTRDRLDKAAATQMVFEDALVHIVDFLIRATGSDRLVLTGGAALNAVANMHLLEHFDESYYDRVLRRSTRLHLWVPPVAGDAGVTLGAAYAFAAAAGAGVGAPMTHAFFCGRAPTTSEILGALDAAADVAWICVGDTSASSGIAAIADLMAFITARDGIVALFQGPAETGPRALGHRSIIANPCNPRTRELLNERVKYREMIRPLAPMATLAAAKRLFDLCEGAADDAYNAYNYMVLTARAKPQARLQVPAVVHADGTARLQIVREEVDAVTYAYLKALGRRIGVEIAVNTSFNVAGPIAQSPAQALDTLRRAVGMDGVFLFAREGPVFLAWTPARACVGGQIRAWVDDWQRDSGASLAVCAESVRAIGRSARL
jgi:carbamoyltransferase